MLGFEDFNYLQAIILGIVLYGAYKVGQIRAEFDTLDYFVEKINELYDSKSKRTATAKDIIAFVIPGYYEGKRYQNSKD